MLCKYNHEPLLHDKYSVSATWDQSLFQDLEGNLVCCKFVVAVALIYAKLHNLIFIFLGVCSIHEVRIKDGGFSWWWKFLRTTVWKQECSCVRKGGLSFWAKTLFSTIVHSTSSSWITTSFFRILMAYSSSVDFISANITCGCHRSKVTLYQRHSQY